MKPPLSNWFTPDGMVGEAILGVVNNHPGSILLESNAPSKGRQGYLFTDPQRIIVVSEYSDVLPALRDVEQGVSDGLFAAGFVSYEAGLAFEDQLPKDRLPKVPLVWFGLYKRPARFDQSGKTVTWGGVRPPGRRPKKRNEMLSAPGMFQPYITQELHAESVERIQRYIAEGDTYQVNFTFPLTMNYPGSPADWYDTLRRSQRVAYSAFINTGSHCILSVSPELFFRRQGSQLILKPMKGTAPRGRTEEEDRRQKEWLGQSNKNRAENLMIVDLLRNDAGRIARPGSVRVRKYYEIERYETVFQATSTIEARLRPDVGIPQLFQALFPSGSVTGAPKIRTMQIIRELETTPRGVYTGSIGFIAPSNTAVFSVAIRTAVIDKGSGQAVVGVGSGVVHDSELFGEYEECLLKGRFLLESRGTFQLIETMLWTSDRGWSLLPLHLKRLWSSARYFGFAYDVTSVRQTLANFSKGSMKKKGPMRARLLLDRLGNVTLSGSRLEDLPKETQVRMARGRTDSRDRFLFHKTTRREFYEAEYAAAQANGYFDALFQNEKGEVTEGTRTNVVIRSGNRYFTPPLDSGVLPGTFRAHMLSSKRKDMVEKTLYPDDLAAADEIFLCNAVRGMVRITIPELSP
ncbi:MAG: aminodeoxychorismate synthase component I [Bacteroidota bacterium]